MHDMPPKDENSIDFLTVCDVTETAQMNQKTK